MHISASACVYVCVCVCADLFSASKMSVLLLLFFPDPCALVILREAHTKCCASVASILLKGESKKKNANIKRKKKNHLVFFLWLRSLHACAHTHFMYPG